MKSLVKAIKNAWITCYKEMFDNVVTHIADDRQLRDHLHDPEPDADVLRPLGHGPPCLADELLGVQSDLHPVVEESKQGRQGEGRHEDGDETELEH